MGGLLHLVQRGGDWTGGESPPRCTKCNSPAINGQCANFILFDKALARLGFFYKNALYKFTVIKFTVITIIAFGL